MSHTWVLLFTDVARWTVPQVNDLEDELFNIFPKFFFFQFSCTCSSISNPREHTREAGMQSDFGLFISVLPRSRLVTLYVFFSRYLLFGAPLSSTTQLWGDPFKFTAALRHLKNISFFFLSLSVSPHPTPPSSISTCLKKEQSTCEWPRLPNNKSQRSLRGSVDKNVEFFFFLFHSRAQGRGCHVIMQIRIVRLSALFFKFPLIN